MGFNAKLTKRKALGFFWLALAMIWTATTAQAQLIIDVFPSQDDPTKTLWLFGISDRLGNIQSGTSIARYSSTLRSEGNYHLRDSWKLQLPELYIANKLTNELVSLSPLFSSTNNPIDIESITTRFAGSARVISPFYSGRSFPANVTNAPTVTTGSGSKTIGKIFMNDGNADDEIGIRHTGGSNLWYTNGQTTIWFGSGILNKPIGDFFTGTFNNNLALAPRFASTSSQSADCR